MNLEFHVIPEPLRHPGDGDLDEMDRMLAATAPLKEQAGFDWHAWVATKTPKQVADMLTVLSWRLRYEAENNVALGQMLQKGHS